MIQNITKGDDFEGVGRYLYSVGKHHEAHVDPRLVAGANVMLDDSRQWRPWVADMQWCAAQRPVARPVWHCSLRAAPEDPVLDDAQWGDIAREHVEALGLSEHPWVAVRHGDDHVHIVASRVDGRGRVWRDSWDYKRGETSARAIEERHGLTRVTDDRPAGKLATTTPPERDRARREGIEPYRVQLREAMHAARDSARRQGVEGWQRHLEQRGVMFRAATTKDGKVTGYSVSLPGWTDAAGAQIWLKASAVDRQLSWSKVRRVLGADQPGRDTLPLTAAQLAAQAHPTSVQAAVRKAAADLARGRGAGGEPTPTERRRRDQPQPPGQMRGRSR